MAPSRSINYKANNLALAYIFLLFKIKCIKKHLFTLMMFLQLPYVTKDLLFEIGFN